MMTFTSRASVYTILAAIIHLSLVVHSARKNRTIIITASGFRHDYAKNTRLKEIQRIIDNGVFAAVVNPVYPAFSYPNLYSLVTGLYVENHGFTGDVVYDGSTNELLEPIAGSESRRAKWWNGTEPFWVTAEKNGLKTALYWWPGCEVEIKNTHTSICEMYRSTTDEDIVKVDILERFDDIIEMFLNDELDVVLIYYDLPKKYSLIFGPESQETESALHLLDELLKELNERLVEKNLQNHVNLLVTSDVGATNLDPARTIYLDIEKFSTYIKHQVSYGSLSVIFPREGMIDQLFSELTQKIVKGLTVYKQENIPIRYHLKENKRSLPILLQAEPGFFINPLKDTGKVKGLNYTRYKGMLGYDPSMSEDMKTAFFATGPAFKKNTVIQELNNVDFYNIICRVIGVTPLPNNGSWERVLSIFDGLKPDYEVRVSAATFTHSSTFVMFSVMSFLYFPYKINSVC